MKPETTNVAEQLLRTPQGCETFKWRIAETCYRLKPNLRGATLDFSFDDIIGLARAIDSGIEMERYQAGSPAAVAAMVTRIIDREVATFLDARAQASAGLS